MEEHVNAVSPHRGTTVADLPIASLWHPTKNGALSPYAVSAGSNRLVWWKCPKGPDHEWQSSPKDRTARGGQGCPFCRGFRVSVTNSLATQAPAVAAQWHYARNAPLTPDQVVAGSSKTAWWKCPEGPDHEWPARLADRVNKDSGCPFCRGLKVSVTNSVRTRLPHVVDEWHPDNPLTPDQVTFGSSKRVLWRCRRHPDHVWSAPPNARLHSARGCPFCENMRVCESNCLATTHPKLAQEWHPSKNAPLTPHDVVAGTGREVWWRCAIVPSHQWRTSVNNRTANESGCPHCNPAGYSLIELQIAHEVASFLPFDVDKHDIAVGARSYKVDMVVGHGVLVEFDGCRWHKGRDERDARKTKALVDAGYRVIRVREAPLKAVGRDDVLVPQNDAKGATIAVLRRMEGILGRRFDDLPSYGQTHGLRCKGEAAAHFETLLRTAHGRKADRLRAERDRKVEAANAAAQRKADALEAKQQEHADKKARRQQLRDPVFAAAEVAAGRLKEMPKDTWTRDAVFRLVEANVGRCPVNDASRAEVQAYVARFAAAVTSGEPWTLISRAASPSCSGVRGGEHARVF